jgi:hypothetical protein
MQIAGHKTRAIFDRYHIISDADLREAATRQASYVAQEMVTNTVTISNIGRFFASASKEGTT